jgi:hypothetical protein
MGESVEYFDSLKIGKIINSNLPTLPKQSNYSWKDIFYSLSSIYFCNGEYIEDINSIIKSSIGSNHFCKIASSDTVLKRLKELDQGNETCRTKRGAVDHLYSSNDVLTELNIKLLKNIGVFDTDVLTLDYDNTIIYSEKTDCKMTYKKKYGYQPGACTVNESNVVYLENRNGNSDTKSYQHETLGRMFEQLKKQKLSTFTNFRTDSASYQFEVIQMVKKKCTHFYISAKPYYVEKYFSDVETWEETVDSKEDKIWVGEIKYIPFLDASRKNNVEAKEYRLIVKKKGNKEGQINLLTQYNLNIPPLSLMTQLKQH